MYKIIASTFWLGKNLVYLPTCPSTNDFASKLIFDQKAIEGTTVITAEQTFGRGQRGNQWESLPHKNLTFSIILKPAFLTPDKQFELNIAISNSIYKALAFLIPLGLKVKWPNDIYYNDQKIGGILIENQLQGRKIAWTVIGIGLNVNQQSFNTAKATSISTILERQLKLPELLESILVEVESFYMKLKNNGIGNGKENYLSNLYRYQEYHEFEDLRNETVQRFTGQILGIDSSGRLAIEKAGKIEYFNVKEVAFI